MTGSETHAAEAKQRSYTISQLSRELDVTPRALRFYEDKGLLSPSRNGLNRVYSVRDRARLKLVLSGRKVGFSLNDLREMLDLYDLGDNQRAQLRAAYKKHRQQIEVLNQQRHEIDEALDALHKGVAWLETKLDTIEPEASVSENMRAYDEMARARLEADHDNDT